MVFGGPDGELAAALRYLNQRYGTPYAEVKGVLTDIGVSVAILHTYFYKMSKSNIEYVYCQVVTFNIEYN